MVKVLAYTLLSFLFIFSNCSNDESKNAYVFSYFKGNGEDGLHLAYSYNGLKWQPLNNDQSFLTPAVGKAKLMRDPCIVLGPDEIFHMVWTAGWWEKGIGIAHSKDLIEWSEQTLIPVMEHETDAVNCWAPEIFYDEVIQKYIIYWATTIPGRFPETDDTGDKGQNISLNHRIYYVTTSDFEEYSETKLFYDDGFNVIDATIVKEGEQYVMFLKDETKRPEAKKNIRIAFSDQVLGPYTSASKPITGDFWAEGPTAVKIKDIWHLYFDKYRKHQFGLLTSNDLKTWSDSSSQLELPEGIRHGTVIRVDNAILKTLITKQ